MISLQIIDKSSRNYRAAKSVGYSSDPEEIASLQKDLYNNRYYCQEQSLEPAASGRQ